MEQASSLATPRLSEAAGVKFLSPGDKIGLSVGLAIHISGPLEVPRIDFFFFRRVGGSFVGWL